jgi:hypothetical protein
MRFKLLPEAIVGNFVENILEDDLNRMYTEFMSEFDTERKSSSEGFIKSEVNRVNHNYRKSIKDLNGLIGVDLPAMFESDSESGKIMILAQDPLRSAKDFKQEGKVLIGTPYALHSSFYREGSSNLYYQLLIEIGRFYRFSYLTDVAKVYAESSNIIGLLKKGSHNEVKESAYKTLAFEIKEIKPNTILAMGTIAQNALNQESMKQVLAENNIRVIKTPHLRARHSTWKNLGGSTDEQKLKYIRDTIAVAQSIGID